MKTDNALKTDIYKAIKGTDLEKAVSGTLSKRGRPNGSRSEDIVISILANEGCGEIQRAYVNVNIYVSDKRNSKTKAWEPDDVRLDELSMLCEFLFSLIGDNWHTVASECSQTSKPTGATFEDGHTEHFINNKLFIEIYNG